MGLGEGAVVGLPSSLTAVEAVSKQGIEGGGGAGAVGAHRLCQVER